MKIQLALIETAFRINSLGLQDRVHRETCDELYYDTDLQLFIVFIKARAKGYTGKVILPSHAVKAAHVLPEAMPKHQPLGTPPRKDTPKGTKKRYSMKTFKENQEKKTSTEE